MNPRRIPLQPRTARAAPGAGAAPGFWHRSRAGFSLVEIVICIIILVVIAAASVPTIRGMKEEAAAREPLSHLQALAKEARRRAMKERRPYQVAITPQGFTASRYFDPYLSYAELTTYMTTLEAAETDGEATKEPAAPTDPSSTPADPNSAGNINEQSKPGPTGQLAPVQPEWTDKYTLPEGTQISLHYWREGDTFTPVEGETVKLWVFQPNGMCEPIYLRLTNQNASITAQFNALTADIVREVSASL